MHIVFGPISNQPPAVDHCPNVFSFGSVAQQAFWCLVQICEKYLPGYYSAGLVSKQICVSLCLTFVSIFLIR